MSTVKTNNVQIGQSVTATNNFTWYQPATPDGTVRLGNGNAGSATDRVTVTSAGNVGIGTTSPSYPLDVSGSNIRLSYNTSGGPVVLLNNTQGTSFKSQITWQAGGAAKYSIGVDYAGAGTNSFYWYDELSSSTRMLLDSSGNLGIGTSSPVALLHVQSTTTAVARVQGGTGTGYGAYIGFHGQGAFAGYVGTESGVLGSGTANNLLLYSTGTNSIKLAPGGTTSATFDSSGNLGLGVTPFSWANNIALDIKAAGFSSYFYLDVPDSVVSLNAYATASNTWKYKYSSLAATAYRQISGQHQWYTAPSGTAGNAISFTQAMTLDASGRLVIGDTSTDSYLKVLMPDGATANLARFQQTNQGNLLIQSQQGGQSLGGSNGILFSNATGVMGWRTNASSGNAQMILDGSGNLMLGVTSTSYKLYVAGPSAVVASIGGGNLSYFENSSTTGYGLSVFCNSSSSPYRYFEGYSTSAAAQKIAIYTDGNVRIAAGSTYGNLSDASLKTDIVDASPKLADVCALKVRNFATLEDPASKFIGFIAQEFEEVFPSLVTTSTDVYKDGREVKGVKESALIPILVKAIQELSAELNELKKRIN